MIITALKELDHCGNWAVYSSLSPVLLAHLAEQGLEAEVKLRNLSLSSGSSLHPSTTAASVLENSFLLALLPQLTRKEENLEFRFYSSNESPGDSIPSAF